MAMTRLQAMVSRLEAHSATHPRRYAAKVAALALLGLAALALLVGTAALGVLAVVAYAGALLLTGGMAWLVLAGSVETLLLLATPLAVLVHAAGRALALRLQPPDGVPVDMAQAPALQAELERLQQARGGPALHQVLVDDDMNAAVVHRPRFGLLGPARNTLVLGLPLLDSLSPSEALAVVAHEYGHLAGAHSRFSTAIYRLRHLWNEVYAVVVTWDDPVGRWLARGVAWYAPYFNAYTAVQARAQEFEADRYAAARAGVPALTDALKRCAVAGACRGAFMDGVFGLIPHEPQPPTDVFEVWAAVAARQPENAAGLLEQALNEPGDLDDAHPNLRARLQALGDTEPAALPLAPDGASAAQAWLGDALPPLRVALQAFWAAQVAPAWADRHASLRARDQRRVDLCSRKVLDADEAFELLDLRIRLEPGIDRCQAAVDFNAQHPGHAYGLLFEGALRVDADDATGLGLLERAMALDPELVEPCCECALSYWRRHGGGEQGGDWSRRLAIQREREQAAREQDSCFDPEHALVPHGLDAATVDALHAVVGAVKLRGVAALYLARRILPADRRFESYVLGVQLKPWARWARRETAIATRLAAQAWPVSLMVVVLAGVYAPYRVRMARVSDPWMEVGTATGLSSS